MTPEVREYYHRVLPFFDRELAGRGDGELWAWAASAPPGCHVLEIGAGTGRATAFLARTAGRVVAFDLAPEMVAVARRRLGNRSNISLFVADMREIAFRVRFDLVVAVDDPFVHLTEDDDRDRAFTAAARHLLPGGRLLLDTAWFSPEKRHAAGEPGGLVFERSAGEGLEVRETWHCDPSARLCTTSFEYRLKGQKVEHATFPARLWSREELEHRARAADLRITHLWGDYDRRPWERETSPRLIAELQLR